MTDTCTAPRVDMFDPDLPEMSAEAAWAHLIKADKEKDLDDVLIASSMPLICFNTNSRSTSNAMQRLNTPVATQLISLISRLVSVQKDSRFT
jgi:hypothetical protein